MSGSIQFTLLECEQNDQIFVEFMIQDLTLLSLFIPPHTRCRMKTPLKKIFTILSVLAFIAFSSSAFAVCKYNDVDYETGTRIGSYVCMEDGTWGKA
jgi:hypothetical protein